jgi:hypothetical protein
MFINLKTLIVCPCVLSLANIYELFMTSHHKTRNAVDLQLAAIRRPLASALPVVVTEGPEWRLEV